MPRKVADPVARFWAKVDKSGECWIWTSTAKKGGYGSCHFNGAETYVHRLSWELAYGPIPSGLLVCHTCDNPPCVNPAHLFLGTHKDNSLDMARKGRGGRPRKLTAQQVYEIRTIHALATRRGGLIQRIAHEYGVASNSISRIVHRHDWQHI